MYSTIVITRNTYTYHCQYKTRTRTTAITRNTYTYHCHNTKHVYVPLS